MHIEPSGELAFLILVFSAIGMAAFFFYDLYRESKKNKKKG